MLSCVLSNWGLCNSLTHEAGQRHGLQKTKKEVLGRCAEGGRVERP